MAEACARFDRVWYLADGVYSMLGDVAPVARIMDLVDQHDNLHVYFDDAHGFGWRGTNGRGWVLDAVPWHPRMVVAVSLAKSFGSGGSALAFPNSAMAERVQLSGGTMVFSGPLHPAQLGAAIASADIHLSPELEERQAVLQQQIRLMREGLLAADLPVVNTDPTPLWFVRVGGSEHAMELGERMMDDGFYLNFCGLSGRSGRTGRSPAHPHGLSHCRPDRGDDRVAGSQLPAGRRKTRDHLRHLRPCHEAGGGLLIPLGA